MGTYLSAKTGTQIDAGIALSQQNKEAIATHSAAIEVLQNQKWNAVPNVLTATATLDFGDIFTGATTGMTVNVPGARANDVVLVGMPAASLGRVFVNARVIVDDTVSIELTNESGGTASVGSKIFKVVVLKF
jgi:hypothetical protein